LSKTNSELGNVATADIHGRRAAEHPPAPTLPMSGKLGLYKRGGADKETSYPASAISQTAHSDFVAELSTRFPCAH
jgi:hypothetical protein